MTALEPHYTTTVLRLFFRDHPGDLVPEENFWTLWCKGRLTEADTLTIQLGTTLSGPIRVPTNLANLELSGNFVNLEKSGNLRYGQGIFYNMSHGLRLAY